MNSLRGTATMLSRVATKTSLKNIQVAQMGTVLDHTIKITFVDREVKPLLPYTFKYYSVNIKQSLSYVFYHIYLL